MQDVKRALHLSKSAQFQCRLVILDVINIPLVTGTFRVKWKFQHTPYLVNNNNNSSSSSNNNEEQSVEWAWAPETGVLSRSLSRDETAKERSRSTSVSKDAAVLRKVPQHEPKGSTKPASLKSHTATFNRIVSCPVTMSINKKGTLEKCLVKLSVKKDATSDESKLGHVYIDLAEFVSDSSSEGHSQLALKPRRFLLSDGKTNALLRVHIELEYLSGERNFITKSEEEKAEKAKTTSTASSGSSSISGSIAFGAVEGAATQGSANSSSASSMASTAPVSSVSGRASAMESSLYRNSPSAYARAVRRSDAISVVERLFESTAPSHHSLHHSHSSNSLRVHANHQSSHHESRSNSPDRRNASPHRCPSRPFLMLPTLSKPAIRPSSSSSQSSHKAERHLPTPLRGFSLSNGNDAAPSDRGRREKRPLSLPPTPEAHQLHFSLQSTTPTSNATGGTSSSGSQSSQWSVTDPSTATAPKT